LKSGGKVQSEIRTLQVAITTKIHLGVDGIGTKLALVLSGKAKCYIWSGTDKEVTGIARRCFSDQVYRNFQPHRMLGNFKVTDLNNLCSFSLQGQSRLHIQVI